MPVEDILPLSPLQEGLLFHALYDAQWPDLYTAQFMLDLEGPLERDLLQTAANALLQRHASLRAAFQYENLDRPVQIIMSSLGLPWRFVDLCSLCLLYTSPSPRDPKTSRMPSSA